MTIQRLVIKKHRHIAIDINEIIALDFNESLNDIKIYLRGGGNISIEGKRAAKLWNTLSGDFPELIAEFEELNQQNL